MYSVYGLHGLYRGFGAGSDKADGVREEMPGYCRNGSADGR